MSKKKPGTKEDVVAAGGFVSLGNILENYKPQDQDKYISREFQKFGYDLAEELGDLEHKSLYIKLAKETPRGLLEAAKNYVKDAKEVKNKGALYMWKLGQLKLESKKRRKQVKRKVK